MITPPTRWLRAEIQESFLSHPFLKSHSSSIWLSYCFQSISGNVFVLSFSGAGAFPSTFNSSAPSWFPLLTCTTVFHTATGNQMTLFPALKPSLASESFLAIADEDLKDLTQALSSSAFLTDHASVIFLFLVTA